MDLLLQLHRYPCTEACSFEEGISLWVACMDHRQLPSWLDLLLQLHRYTRHASLRKASRCGLHAWTTDSCLHGSSFTTPSVHEACSFEEGISLWVTCMDHRQLPSWIFFCNSISRPLPRHADPDSFENGMILLWVAQSTDSCLCGSLPGRRNGHARCCVRILCQMAEWIFFSHWPKLPTVSRCWLVTTEQLSQGVSHATSTQTH